jgi:hypothetical protein
VSFTVLLDNYIAAFTQMAANKRILSSDVTTHQVLQSSVEEQSFVELLPIHLSYQG